MSAENTAIETTVDPTSGWLGRYRIGLATTGILLLGFTALRIVLLLKFAETSSLTASQWVGTFWAGLRFDLLVVMIFQLPQVLHMTVNGNQRVVGRFSRFLVHFGIILSFGLLLFILAAEYFFFEEFDSRFNYIAFEYLVYPTEVLTNIWESYPLIPILAGVTIVAVLIYLPLRRMIQRMLPVPLPWQRRYGIALVWLLAIGALWLTTGRESMKVSTNRVVNQSAANGLWTVVENAWTSRFNYNDFYPTLPSAQAERIVVEAVYLPGETPAAGSVNPLDRYCETGRPREDYNVILVLEESLGSDFVGVLGDERGLTPNLDRLTQDSLLFDNFYATGNRTARALEATLTGLPPIPTESILKRDHSQNVESLARILRNRGYETTFVYGGRGIFDGMRSFMLANGFNRFIEQSDFVDPGFTNAWGVSDEAIFDRTIEECDKLQASATPFFATVLSVSNHRPFTYPDGRIDRPSAEQSRDNAVMYSDYAVGRFLDEAKKHAFFADTIIVVLGDHGARVYGAQKFPIESYRVPVWMFLPGGDLAGTRNSTMSCSLDIAPTILAALGGRFRTVMFGRDAISAKVADGRALMQHNHDLALLRQDGRMTLLSLSDDPSAFTVDFDTFKTTPVTAEQVEVDLTVSLFQTANDFYYADRYIAGVEETQPQVGGT